MLTCPVCHTENDEGQEACRTCRTPLPLDVRQAQPPPANGQADQTAKPTTVRQDPWVGRMLGEYKVLGILGRGGMGVVYRAEDVALGRHVALKMVSAELAGNPQMLERFRHEARIQARLSHPGIATVYAFKEVEGEAFLVMELVEGETLRSRLVRCGPLSPREAVPIAVQVLEAMAYAHRMGVIHRDLKPANIVLTPEGTVKLMDFGIAKLPQHQSQLTVTGSLVGTLRYMAPEQIKGLKIDHRADIYSLGVTFFEMLAGRPPFEAKTDYELMQAHLEKPPPPPSRFNRAVGPALDRTLLKALEKDPARRYPSALEFARALEQAQRTAAEATKALEPQATVALERPVAAPERETVALEAQAQGAASRGVSPTRVLEAESPAVPETGRRASGLALGLAAATLLAVAAGGAWWLWPREGDVAGGNAPSPVSVPAPSPLQAEVREGDAGKAVSPPASRKPEPPREVALAKPVAAVPSATAPGPPSPPAGAPEREKGRGTPTAAPKPPETPVTEAKAETRTGTPPPSKPAPRATAPQKTPSPPAAEKPKPVAARPAPRAKIWVVEEPPKKPKPPRVARPAPRPPLPAQVARDLLKALKARGLEKVKVRVDRRFHAVLSGTVLTEDERRQALDVARRHPAVRRVEDKMVIQKNVWTQELQKGQFVDEEAADPESE